MKLLRNIGKGLGGLLVVLVLMLWLSGNNHIYLGLYDTYLQGRTKPAVDDPDLFPYRTIEKGTSKPWAKAETYNQKPLLSATEKAHKDYQSLAFLVIQNQKILQEKYFENYNESTLSNSFSMAKTFLSILTGIAIKEGKLGLYDAVNQYLPDYVEPQDTALKVIHLLNMTSGMNFDESYGNPIGFMAKAYYGSNLRELLLGYHLELVPGKQWEYLGGNNLLLSLLLEKVMGQKVGDYASEKVWKPLGMEYDARWILDHEGGDEKTFSGLYATARDFAKLGQLYLNQGVFDGLQIVQADYVAQSIQSVNVPDQDGKMIDYYGFAWWLTKHEEHEVFYMQGILGQYVIVIPDLDVIIVRLGRTRGEKSNGINPDDLKIWITEGLNQANKMQEN